MAARKPPMYARRDLVPLPRNYRTRSRLRPFHCRHAAERPPTSANAIISGTGLNGTAGGFRRGPISHFGVRASTPMVACCLTNKGSRRPPRRAAPPAGVRADRVVRRHLSADHSPAERRQSWPPAQRPTAQRTRPTQQKTDPTHTRGVLRRCRRLGLRR